MCLSLGMKSAPLTCCHVKYPPSYAALVQTNRVGGGGKSAEPGEAKTWAEKDGTKRQRRADKGRMREDSGGIYPTGILNFHSSSQTHKQVYIKESRRERKRKDDSLLLPTVNDAKMIIMPGSLRRCQNSLPSPNLRQLAKTLSA